MMLVVVSVVLLSDEREYAGIPAMRIREQLAQDEKAGEVTIRQMRVPL